MQVKEHRKQSADCSWDFFSRRIELRPKEIVLIHFLEH